jgi:capsular polysaccharide transport system permease protein
MRSHWEITRSVWHAMFMREAIARITGDRFGWFWMLAEPVAYVVIMVFVKELLSFFSMIGGVGWVPWLVVGIVAFFLFREGVLRSLGAVEANRALFAYRQVKPVDPILVRNALEGILKTIVMLILVAGVALLGYDILPFDPLGAMFIWVSLWLLGLGAGLVISVVATLIPDLARVVRMMMLPIFFLSGAIIPLQTLPHEVQRYILYNPVVHAVEGLRLSFFHGYKTLNGVDLTYLWLWSLALIALGLALHLRFAMRLKAI